MKKMNYMYKLWGTALARAVLRFRFLPDSFY